MYLSAASTLMMYVVAPGTAVSVQGRAGHQRESRRVGSARPVVYIDNVRALHVRLVASDTRRMRSLIAAVITRARWLAMVSALLVTTSFASCSFERVTSSCL